MLWNHNLLLCRGIWCLCAWNSCGNWGPAWSSTCVHTPCRKSPSASPSPFSFARYFFRVIPKLLLHELYVCGRPILDLCCLWMSKTCTRTLRQCEQALCETWADPVLCLFWSRTGHNWRLFHRASPLCAVSRLLLSKILWHTLHTCTLYRRVVMFCEFVYLLWTSRNSHTHHNNVVG